MKMKQKRHAITQRTISSVISYISYTLLLLVLTVSCSSLKTYPPTDSGQSAYQHYSRSLNYYTDERLIAALSEIDLAIRINPSISTFYQLKGQILAEMKKPEEALQAYAKVLEFRSYNPVVLEQMAYLQAEQGRYLQAAHTLKKVVKQAPEKNILWLKVAEYYVKLDKLDFAANATQQYRIYLGDNGTPDPEYFRVLGLIAYHRGNYKQATANLDKCRGSMQFSEGDYIILLKSLFKTGQNEKAYNVLVSDGEKILKKYDVYFYRGWYYFSLGKYKDARRQFELAIQEGSEEVLAYFYLGKCYLKLGQPEKAREMFEIFRERSEKPELIKQLDSELQLY